MARLIDDLVGHQTQLESLLMLARTKRLPHAILLSGPESIGKKTLALAVAQALICESKSEKPCGQCGPCIRVSKQQSESLYILKPDPEYAKPAVKVEDIRALLEKLSLAKMGQARVVIIDEAHLMNEQASNALLKTLEEPSEDLFFFLIAVDAAQMLPTIRSRTQTLRLNGLSVSELKKLKPELPEWAYKSSRGQIDKLMQLTGKQGLAERQEAIALLEQFCFDEEFLLFDDWRKAIKENREWALYNLSCWRQLVRDALIVKTKQTQHIMNIDQALFLKKLDLLPTERLSWLSEALTRAIQDIKGNQDATLVFDSLRVEYARMD